MKYANGMPRDDDVENGPGCTNGANVMQVAGFPFSGIELVQRLLLNATIDSRAEIHPEGLAPRTRNLLCSRRYAIFTSRVHSSREVLDLLSLRAYYPMMKIVYVQRDVPNTAWRLLRARFNTSAILHESLSGGMPGILRSTLGPQCDVMNAWKSAKHHSALDFTIRLERFVHNPPEILFDILGIPDADREDNVTTSRGILRLGRLGAQAMAQYDPAAYITGAMGLYMGEASTKLAVNLTRLSCLQLYKHAYIT